MGSSGTYKKDKESKTRRHFRAEGYQTIDEFVSKFNQGLGEYLKRNWSTDPDVLHHPEDLASNALAYAEAIFAGIASFGAGNTNTDD